MDESYRIYVRKKRLLSLMGTKSRRKSIYSSGFELTHHDWMLGHCPNFYRSITE